MQNHNKREQILDAMQELMGSSNAQAILPKKQGLEREVFITIFPPKMTS